MSNPDTEIPDGGSPRTLPADPAQARVAVARHVLEHLDTLTWTSGQYLHVGGNDVAFAVSDPAGPGHQLLDDVLPSVPDQDCEVCLAGALLWSLAGLGGGVRVEDTQDLEDGLCYEQAEVYRLLPLFGPAQLGLLETVFMCMSTYAKRNTSPRLAVAALEFSEACDSIYLRRRPRPYADPMKAGWYRDKLRHRARQALSNLVANNGTFDPTQAPLQELAPEEL